MAISISPSKYQHFKAYVRFLPWQMILLSYLYILSYNFSLLIFSISYFWQGTIPSPINKPSVKAHAMVPEVRFRFTLYI